MSFAIIWFRDNLRFLDNPPLYYAWISNKALLPLFIYEETQFLGATQKWWLHKSLKSLQQDLYLRGLPFLLKKGDPYTIFQKIYQKLGIFTLYTSLSPIPALQEKASSLFKDLETHLKVSVRAWNTNLLFSPEHFKEKKPQGYKVFKHFWTACLSQEIPEHSSYNLPETKKTPISGYNTLNTETVESLGLLSTPKNSNKKLDSLWEVSETEGLHRLQHFLEEDLVGYAFNRNFLDRKRTSFLSPYLRFGQISPFYIWRHVKNSLAPIEDKRAFLAELGWREFAYHLLYHYPTMSNKPLRQEFSSFAWEINTGHIQSWKEGKTGYPIVDAGMRELWQTGWMHNRVRMIVSSFLVKDLLIPWQIGERWFWDTLLDADLAVNSMNWQWISGSGIDACPYFRIFNPILQGEKFDPEGGYISHFIPELKNLPKKYIHKPFMAPASLLEKCGIALGINYPMPIVNHIEARQKALAAYKKIRGCAPT